MIRQPIVAMMGHVDHGKTLLLDKVRGTAIAAREAGGITQAIGASIIPIETVQKICGPLLEALKLDLTIPGLLFIDTPGHAAFVNLRRRGGNLADMAILVINVVEGLMPQTLECIEILKHYKTPFVIAANKIDLIQGWKTSDKPLLKSISEQNQETQKILDTKIYELVGKLYEMGLEAERFDRVDDYTKQIAIVPTSALKGDGTPELLMVLTGLAQKYLEQGLNISVKGPAQGTVLEVKEDKGLGKTIDVIIYDGSLKVGDTLVIAGLEGPIQTRVKAIFLPAPLQEMREKKTKFKSVKEIAAATGIKIVAPDVDKVISGVSFIGNPENLEQAKEKVQKEIEQVILETDIAGIVVKADSLGSLEALLAMLKEADIPVKKASVGTITKKDITDAEANVEKDPLTAVILGFNVEEPGIKSEKAKIITSQIIYKLIEDYQKWVEEKKKKIELAALEHLNWPCKIELLKGYVFRQSNPAIVGVYVIAGKLKTNTPLMNREGKEITVIKGIQQEQENVAEVTKGKQGAASLPGVIVGRQIHEGDILYSAISEEHFRKFKQFKEYLNDDEKEVLKEIAEIKRKNNPVWGI